MMLQKIAGSLFIAVMLGACTHSVHLVHAGGFIKGLGSGTRIEHTEEQKVYMGFVFDNEYVDRGYQSFQKMCEGGTIHGVVTRFSTSHGFLHWINKVRYEGLCVKS